MTNLNQKIFMAVKISNKQINVNGTLMQNWIYSIWPTSTFYNIDYLALSKRLFFLKCKKIVVCDIIPFKDFQPKSELFINYNECFPLSYENPHYIKYSIGLADFFKPDNIENLTIKNINDKIFDNESIINYTIFIFNNMPFPFIVAAFKMLNILLTAGNNNRRGVLSSVHSRLAQFNVCLEGMFNNSIANSYHNYDRLAIQPIFDHSVLDKIKGFKNITNFFNYLEQYYKMKLNLSNETTNFNWELKKNNLDLKEFIDFCESNNLSFNTPLIK